MKALEGIWQPVYAELDGEEAPRMALEQLELELSGGKYTVRFGGETSDHGTYEIEEAGITLCGISGPNEGRSIPSLVKISGEVLSICYGLQGQRPEKFATGTGRQHYLVNYHRKETGANR